MRASRNGSDMSLNVSRGVRMSSIGELPFRAQSWVPDFPSTAVLIVVDRYEGACCVSAMISLMSGLPEHVLVNREDWDLQTDKRVASGERNAASTEDAS